MTEDGVPKKRSDKIGLWLAGGACVLSLGILVKESAREIELRHDDALFLAVQRDSRFPKRRIDGDQRFLWASGSIDPDQPDSEWFDLTGSPLAVEQFQYGIGKDSIRAIDKPVFVKPDDRRLWANWGAASADEISSLLVLGFVDEGEARAYPVRLLDRHELVNDTVAGKPVTVGW
jgi:hypothetical protein